MMMVGLLRHKNRIGLATSTCSKMYSSVARLNRMSLDSATMMSIASPFFWVRKLGQVVDDVEKSAKLGDVSVKTRLL